MRACLPPNFPRAFSLPQYYKILMMPGEMVILHEFNASYRQIFFDGRPLPDDSIPGVERLRPLTGMATRSWWSPRDFATSFGST